VLQLTIKIQFGPASGQSSDEITSAREMRPHTNVCKWHSVTLRILQQHKKRNHHSNSQLFLSLPAPLIAICGLGAFATLFLRRRFFVLRKQFIWKRAAESSTTDCEREKEMQPASERHTSA
jgi:hypothetical protein